MDRIHLSLRKGWQGAKPLKPLRVAGGKRLKNIETSFIEGLYKRYRPISLGLYLLFFVHELSRGRKNQISYLLFISINSPFLSSSIFFKTLSSLK